MCPRLLDAAAAGHGHDAAELLLLVHDEVRKLAAARMTAEAAGSSRIIFTRALQKI
jgi:hypothetical protein